MGVGFGLMVLIGFAGESPSPAVGVGGFLVIMGLAFFINSRFDAQPRSVQRTPVRWRSRSTPAGTVPKRPVRSNQAGVSRPIQPRDPY